MTGAPESLHPDERVLFDLVATPSVSGHEGAAAAVFARHALALGLRAEIDAAGNAIAHAGRPDAPVHIVLLGHIDTVPGDVPVCVAGGILHGRGSVDAKGPLAAMLVAASRLSLPPDVRVTVAGAVGEEIAGSPGARFLAGQYRPQACVIGEPSGWDGVTLGYKGCVTVTARSTRAMAHSAGPDGSASDDLLAWWSGVRRLADDFNAGRTRVFDRLQATVRRLETSDDGLTQSATLVAGFRLPPGLYPDELIALVGGIKPGGLDHGEVDLAWTGAEVAAVSDRNDPVVRALTASIREAGGQPRPKLKTGTADFNVVAPVWGCPIAAYGPGDSSLDHTPGEHIVLDEYRRSIAVLGRAITGLAETLAAAPPAQLGVAQGRAGEHRTR